VKVSTGWFLEVLMDKKLFKIIFQQPRDYALLINATRQRHETDISRIHIAWSYRLED
jgi:hypothetical protein